MKNQNILNADKFIFLVTLQYSSTNGKFMFHKAQDLKEILEQHDNGKGIESLKIYDVHKEKFKRLSKKDFLKFTDYETEAAEYFKTHYFFK